MDSEIDPTGKDQHTMGAKLDGGKPNFDLVLGGLARALWAVGIVGTDGAIKYVPNGFLEVENGQERYSSAEWRHFFKEKIEGEYDTDSLYYHKAHKAWNALAELELFLIQEEKQGVDIFAKLEESVEIATSDEDEVSLDQELVLTNRQKEILIRTTESKPFGFVSSGFQYQTMRVCEKLEKWGLLRVMQEDSNTGSKNWLRTKKGTETLKELGLI